MNSYSSLAKVDPNRLLTELDGNLSSLNISQRGEVVSRLAHNQKVPGSNPGAATIIVPTRLCYCNPYGNILKTVEVGETPIC
jgi:hypothetical protein